MSARKGDGMRSTAFVVTLVGALLAASPALADDAPLPPDAASEAPATTVVETKTVETKAVVVTPAPPPIAESEAPVAAPVAHAPRYDLLRLGIGARVGYVPNRGFDAFGEDDVLPHLSLEATYGIFTRGKFAFAVGAAFDVGGSSATLRTLQTNLTTWRVTVPLEARYHAKPWVYAFARVALGAAAFDMEAEDGSVPSGKLVQSSWVFATDLSAGASFLLGPAHDLVKRRARFWITPEVGYAFTTKTDVALRPDREAEDALGTDAATHVGALGTSGFFWRLSVALTF